MEDCYFQQLFIQCRIGYGGGCFLIYRNYMLPRKMAIEATADAVNTMRMNDKATQERIAREKAEAMETAKKLR